MMKTILVICVLIAAVCAKPEETYDTRYDNFDVESLVENVRLLKSYGRCFLSAGPCTSEGTAFKKNIPDALKTGCGKCSPRQRHLIRVVVKGFQTKTPDLWQQLVKKEDPTGEYKETLTRFLNGSD